MYHIDRWTAAAAIMPPPAMGLPAPAAAPVTAPCRVRHATGFAIAYHDGYKVVTTFDPLRPAQRTPYFSMLGITERIVGITQGDRVNDPEVAARIRAGRIAEVGTGSGMMAAFNIERLLALRPALVMSGWTDNPAFATHTPVEQAGIPVALNADFMESTPLGRAEWMKFIAVFFDKDAESERIFAEIERRYHAMAATVKTVRHRPTVLYGAADQGAWYLAGGRSYFAQLVTDAGGRYLWADDPTSGSTPTSVEAVLARGRDADIWFCQHQRCYSLASLAAEDERHRLFHPFRTGRVYAHNGTIGAGGGNDYYQSGGARPDRMLADFITIIHPELLPEHRLIWHRHLPARLAPGPGEKQEP